MNKSQFEIWTYNFPGKGEHPVVLISRPERCARSQLVNVLYCTSHRQARAPLPLEVLLNSADGLDWETYCSCDIFYIVQNELLYQRRGRVSYERRRQIRRKIKALFLLDAED